MPDTKKSDDILVTKKMLDETRDELKSEITSVRLEMKSGFERVDSQFSEIKSEIKQLTAAVHRVAVIVEEQNAKNNYVLDGHTNLHDRQDRFEKEIREKVDTVKKIVKSAPPTA